MLNETMKEVKVTSRGQVTIPKEIREALGVQPGDRLIFELSADGVVIHKRVETSPFDEYTGHLSDTDRHDSDQIVRELRGHE